MASRENLAPPPLKLRSYPGAESPCKRFSASTLTPLNMHPGLFILLAFSALTFSARAAIEFSANSAHLSIAALAPEAETIFQFKNTGQSPVTILHIDSGCGCTVATLAKKNYAPGESGQLRVVFTAGARMGTQSSILTVRTDATDVSGEARDIPITVTVDIPEAFVVEPGTLAFARDARPGEMLEATVTATGEAPLPELTATASDKNIQPRLVRPPSVPDQWLLRVSPPSQPGIHSVLLSARFPHDIVKQITVWIVTPTP